MSIPFSNSLEHTLAELERLDLLIQGQVQRARSLNTSDSQFQGLCITEGEIDRLLASPAGLPAFASNPDTDLLRREAERLREAIAGRVRASIEAGVQLRLTHLTEEFELKPFDVDCLLVCLAPELDPRYERFFAYLQDDVTRRRPSIDLILNLLSPSFADKLANRERCLPESPLRANRLIEVFEDPGQPHPTMLARLVCLDDRITQYLLGSNEPDVRLLPFLLPAEKPRELESIQLEADRKSALTRLWAKANSRATVFYFNGPYGAGKRSAAESLCRSSNTAVIALDGERLAGTDLQVAEQRIRLAVREARLQSSAIYWEGFSALLADDKKPLRKVLLAEASKLAQPAFLAGTRQWEPDEERGGVSFFGVEFHSPDAGARRLIWSRILEEMHAEVPAFDLGPLAGKFRFTAGQIHDSAVAALQLAQLRQPDEPRIALADLYEACRQQSAVRLSGLARKVKLHYAWNDIVLPADRIDTLREICNTVRYRAVVYDDWGFDRKLALGKGLSILFSGPPGTGKTMAADIIAGELALDLYKIDLPGVVSKYIGETEKNLARIFDEAESSNAILFFDEADALFGKRSDVKDSHDRYANIEIGYLLQRMEEYEGIVILATNLRRNMDDAFVRRLHFVVEFPFPTEQDRARIWQQVWPREMPRAADLDALFLARRFELAGANIRNVAVAAAFFAAEDGGLVTMPHVLHALRREFQKIGKVIMDDEFETRSAGMPLPAYEPE